MFSTEGAMSRSAWGNVPGLRFSEYQALKVRFNLAVVDHIASNQPEVNRAFSADVVEMFMHPGALPQALN